MLLKPIVFLWLFGFLGFFAIDECHAAAQFGGQPGSIFRAFSTAREAGRAGLGAMWDGSVTSLNSNPAGLGVIRDFQAIIDFGFRGFGRRVHYVGSAWPASANIVIGLGWMSATSGKSLEARTGPSLEPDFLFSAGQNMLHAGISYQIHEKVILGLGGKLYHQRVYVTSQVGFGLDAGIIWFLARGYGVGLSIRDMGGSLRTIEIPVEKFPFRVQAGLSGKIPTRILPMRGYLELGYTQKQAANLGVGIDIVVRPEITFRTGWNRRQMAMGLALAMRRGRWALQLDYALSSSPIEFFHLEHRLGLGFALGSKADSTESTLERNMKNRFFSWNQNET